jgi:ATP-dependent Clp protease ATP-binding subunit ClpC
MFERFSDRARQVVVLSQDEARSLKHGFIGTEHLLLGLLREGEGVAATALAGLGVTIETVRAEVVNRVGEGEQVMTGQIPFTPRAKNVLELSLREALSLGNTNVGTEHFLLGLVQIDEGVAIEILRALDADADAVRNEVERLISGRGYRPETSTAKPLRPLPPLSANLRQALTDAVDAVEAAKKTAKQEDDTRRMAIIVHAERLLESLLESSTPDTEAASD